MHWSQQSSGETRMIPFMGDKQPFKDEGVFCLQQRYQFLDHGLIQYTEWFYDRSLQAGSKKSIPITQLASFHIIKAPLFQRNIHGCFAPCSIFAKWKGTTLLSGKKCISVWEGRYRHQEQLFLGSELVLQSRRHTHYVQHGVAPQNLFNVTLFDRKNR